MRSLPVALIVLGQCALLSVSLAAAAEGRDDAGADVSALIKKLGDQEYAVREAATLQLIEIGSPALPALREAAKSSDPEIAARAKRAVAEMTSPAKREELVRQGQEAFEKGDYAAMARFYGRAAACENSVPDDAVWIGHAHQLAGNWKQAVAAYRMAVQKIDAPLVKPDGPPAPAGINAPGAADLEIRAHGPIIRNGPVRLHGLTDPSDVTAINRRRDQLMLVIGLLERDEVKDLAAAAATFTQAAGQSETLKASIQDLAARYEEDIRRQISGAPVAPKPFRNDRLGYPLLCLKELAVTQERLGRPADALASWSKVSLVSRLYNVYFVKPDIAAMGRLVQQLPADKPLPETASLVVLSPANPVFSPDLKDPQWMARACDSPFNRGAHYYDFALSPPPGQEFAAIEACCDIEQIEPQYGGHFSCWAMTGGPHPGRLTIGSLSWPAGEPTGRKTVTKRFDVPPGAGLLYVQTGTWPGKFTIHQVQVKPTFRPRSAAGAGPSAGVWIQNEALPPGGQLTYDGQPRQSETADTDFPAGRHVFAYEVPGRPAQRLEATLQGGGRYGLFINLDSPLAPVLTNLRGAAGIASTCSAPVRLADGRWLIAYADDSRIMLATSKDLATWDEPWPLAHNSVFQNVAPSLIVDREGAIWLAWFSNRLDFDPMGQQGYRLWLASSRDGREWTRPQPASAKSDGSWPLGTPRMLRTPAGKYWMFWREFAATADSPAGLTQLRPISMEGGSGQTRDPFVAVGADGRMHMVFDKPGQGIFYSTSKDGWQWAPPVRLVEPEQRGAPVHPQLVLSGSQAALIYGTHVGGWMRRGTLGPAPEFGPSVKIGGRVALLSEGGPVLTADGKMVLLAGQETVWLLRSDLAAILPPAGK